MRVEPDLFSDARAVGGRAARLVADGLAAARTAGRSYVLGCPSGRSAASTYQALADIVRTERLSLDHLVLVMMDEYVVRSGQGAHLLVDEGEPHSCVRFGRQAIVRPLDAAAGPGRGTRPENYWYPDPADPAAYDDGVRNLGGVDLFLLASGSTDGHVAFNGAGAPRTSRTRVVQLSDSTRRDNLATFRSFGGDLRRVPQHGVTIGIDTIVATSASVVMLIHGAEKRRTARRLLAAEAYDPCWPATVVAECSRPHLFLDREAAMPEPATAGR